MSEERKAEHRFGGAYNWLLADDECANVGEVVAGENKAYMGPACLVRYEQTLRLSLPMSWTLRQLLAHSWVCKGPSFPSAENMAKGACLSRQSILESMKRLEELGYIRRVTDEEAAKRRSKTWDVSPTYLALSICIMCDPTSKWARARGGSITPAEAEEIQAQNGVRFYLDYHALGELALENAVTAKEKEAAQHLLAFASLKKSRVSEKSKEALRTAVAEKRNRRKRAE